MSDMYDTAKQEKIARQMAHVSDVIRHKRPMITTVRNYMEEVVDNTCKPIVIPLKEFAQVQKPILKHESIEEPFHV